MVRVGGKLRLQVFLLLVLVNAFCFTKEKVYAQAGNLGSITVTVTDPTKAFVPGTHLTLVDKDTNITREGTTLNSGTYTFEALTPAEYRLTVDHTGFQAQNIETVVVQSGVATPVPIVLKVGSDQTKIEVSAVSVPVIETSSNTLSTSISLDEVNNLPVNGRSLISLQSLTPGYTSATGNGTGTFNGLAGAAYGAQVDGVNSTSMRNNTGSGDGSSLTLRIENIQEFTVQGGELDPSQGAGRSAAQTLFVTNRGTNKFHGRVFEDFQNRDLNANSWSNDNVGLPRGHLVLNDFGGNVGGPIWKDRLFFFANYSMNISPNTANHTAVVPTAAAMQGYYQYIVACAPNSSGVRPSTCPTTTNTINVLQYAQNANLDPNVNLGTLLNYNLIATTYQYGTLTHTATQYNTLTQNFQTPAKSTNYYPSGRIDFAATSKLNLNLSGNFSNNVSKGNYPGEYAGPYFQQKYTGTSQTNYVLAFGADYTIKPTILNQFKVGYLYTNFFFSPEAKGYCIVCQGNIYMPFQSVSMANIAYTGGGQFYPYLTLSDDVSWQKGAHTIKFGGNAWRQQDHYYNAPTGQTDLTLGMISQDPAYNALVNQIPAGSTNLNLPANVSGANGDVTALYAMLNGRVSAAHAQLGINLATKQYQVGGYNLDELAKGGGLYLMDSWRAKPGLTLNYGLRWDFIGDQHDLKSAYTGPSAADLFGSSGFLNIFQPGANSGSTNPLFTSASHKYHANLVMPQPQVGFAYNPNNSDNWLGRLLGPGKTVIRGSFTLKNYTVGGQNFWQNASNAGFNFYSQANTNASVTTGPQYFTPGTVHLVAPAGYTAGSDPQKACPDPITTCVNASTMAAGVVPALNLAPATYQQTITQASLFFQGAGAIGAINPNIKQPYTQSWTLGFQRQITHSSAIEIRYVGNHTVHDWLNINYNEYNGLNNGFLQDFKNAQANLALSNGKTFQGPNPTPIMTAAFAGSNVSQFTNASYINDLNIGAMGTLVASIAGNETYYCNVVGKQFAPCSAVASAPLTTAFPSNLFQANAFAEGRSASYMDSVGSANYNSLQVEFRQKVAHGLDLNANYTYGKILGYSQQGSTGSGPATFFTLHNIRLNYVPSAYDIRNTFHLSSTYALPFGKNKAFLSDSRALNYLVGGWTLGGIFIYQSGAPSLLTGNYSSTLNSASDGGVNFVGGNSARTIQKQVHIRSAPAGNNYKYFLPASLISPASLNPSIGVPNTTPGTIGNHNYIYGPKWNNLAMNVTKDLPIFERVHMNIQAQAFNLPNHPAWGLGNTSVQSTTFGTTGTLLRGARTLELRANITF